MEVCMPIVVLRKARLTRSVRQKTYLTPVILPATPAVQVVRVTPLEVLATLELLEIQGEQIIRL